MFCQITADKEQRISLCIVLVQHPSLVFPQFRPLPAHSIPQSGRTSWYSCLLTSDHVVQIPDGQCLSNKKKNHQYLHLWPTHLCFSWSRRHFPNLLRWLHLGFNIISIHPCLIFCYDVLKKVSLPFALASSSWLISARFSSWSSVNKCSTNFALTWCIWRFSVKI